MNSYVAEFFTILDSFYWLHQYHKHSYRGKGRGGGEPWSDGLILCVNWKQPNGISWSYLQLHITYKTKSMLNLINQSCADL